MTTANNVNGQTEEKIAALYCRLSVDDDKKDAKQKATDLRLYYAPCVK